MCVCVRVCVCVCVWVSWPGKAVTHYAVKDVMVAYDNDTLLSYNCICAVNKCNTSKARVIHLASMVQYLCGLSCTEAFFFSTFALKHKQFEVGSHLTWHYVHIIFHSAGVLYHLRKKLSLYLDTVRQNITSLWSDCIKK